MFHIIGTAGHIDHGKTALVRALTGQDTDRLKEEKERGISIDLGFAYMDLTSGERVGIVDVPGHERFIRNMLAGAHAIDLALLVVAADDGVMPQTEEHLDIVHLLGVARAVVAISKADVVDARRLDAVADEVRLLLDGTRLHGAPICPVSSLTGAGIDDLRRQIELQLAASPPRQRAGYFRLPIDRVFVLHGHGTVVTGTAVAGSVRVGDTLRLLPGAEQARVRSVQVHAAEVAEATCGQRVALNLVGIEKSEIARGHVVCDPLLDRVSDRFDAWLELRPAARHRLKSHQAVRVHAGTAEAMGKVILLDGSAGWEPKQSGFCQIVLREPIHILRGDHFIVRNASAERTLGGGVVVHPFARRHKRGEARLLETLQALSAPGADGRAPLHALLDLTDEFACDVAYLAQASGARVEDVCTTLRGDPSLRALPNADHPQMCTTLVKWKQMEARAVDALRAFHAQSPRAPGMEMESLHSQIAGELPAKLFRTIIDALVNEKAMVRDESVVRLPGHRVSLQGDEEDLALRVEALIASADFTPPAAKEIAATLQVAPGRLATILQQIERDKRIVRVGDGMYFATDAVRRAADLIRAHCQAHGEISAAAFRDRLDASRKYSIALLDYFDRTGFTLRVGDVRKLRR